MGAAPLSQLQLSNGKAIAVKPRNVVDLYVSPPAYAIMLSVDEKSQTPVLDRTQSGQPLKRGRGPPCPTTTSATAPRR